MEVMNVNSTENVGEKTEIFQKFDNFCSSHVKNANDCRENVANEQKISASKNKNVTNSVAKVMSVEKDSKSSIDSITNGYVDEKIRRAIDIVVGYSRVSDETKERLKNAVTDVHCKTMSEQEACQSYKLAVSYFRTYYNMVEKLLDRANLIKQHNRNIISTTDESKIEGGMKNEEAEISSQTNYDKTNVADNKQTKIGKETPKVKKAQKNLAVDISAIDKKRIDKCIDVYCKTSPRHSAKAVAIRQAVGMVLYEGCTGVDAARATNLTPRTVLKHVCIVRNALNLPQYRKAKQQTTHKYEKKEMKEKDFSTTDNDREIATMLIDENFGCVEAKDLSGTGIELESKIDKLLREFSCDADMSKIREAVIEIFSEQKSSEMYKAKSELPVTIVSSYVRLLKGFLWAENMMKKAKGTTVALPRCGSKRLCANKERDDVKGTELPRLPEPDGILAKKKCKSTNIMLRGVFTQKIDVLTLFVENGVKNEEQLMKNVISYLISHQYRRSETAQTNMQICLEHILLDGLSIAETLKIHDGPNEGILEIYHKRCRDAFAALTIDFSAFVVALNSLNESEKDRPEKKRARISNGKIETKPISTRRVGNVNTLKFDTVDKLFTSIPQKAKTLLHDLIMKLLDINFPLEKRLVNGLLQMIGERMAVKYVLDDKLLENCVAYFQEKHNNTAA